MHRDLKAPPRIWTHFSRRNTKTIVYLCIAHRTIINRNDNSPIQNRKYEASVKKTFAYNVRENLPTHGDFAIHSFFIQFSLR